nr:hypothetical protein [Tanacetum cinerariifolium]
DTMADQRTMAELLRAPTEGYAKAIVVPSILAEQFELKHSLINMMTTDQFFGLEKDNPHDHIHWVARRWLEKEPPRSIHTWEDLVSKFINEFFPPSRITNLRNEISNFQQRFDESFHEAWDRYKDLLRACPHHGFTKLHQLVTFYNALNAADQDSLNAVAGGNLLERPTPPPSSVKSVEEIFVTYGGAHPYYQCLAASGNTFPKLRDNIQGYVSAAAVNYNQGNSIYRPPEKVKRINKANMKSMQTQINMVKNELRNEMKNSIQASLSNQTNEIKNMMASLLQMNTASTSGSRSLPSNTVANPKGELKAITTQSGHVLDGPTVPTPPLFINLDEDERIEETLTDPDLSEYTIKVPPPPVQKYKPLSLREYVVHQRDPLHPNIPYPSRMLKQKQQEKDEPSGNPTFHPELTSPKVNHDIFDSEGGNVLPEKLIDLDSTKDLHPPLYVNPLSGNTTYSYSSNPLLEEFTDELALITFPLKYDDDLQFDIKSDLKEMEFLIHQDIDSNLKDSIDQSNLANLADIFIDSMTEMFTHEHALDYSSPPIFDEYDDDFLEVESDAENLYDDPFDSRGEKIKESKLLIDELDLPCDFLLPFEYDSFISQDFSRVDALPSTNNEDKVFNLDILSQENPFEIITRVVQDKKLATSNSSLVLEDFDPPFYEPLFLKKFP